MEEFFEYLDKEYRQYGDDVKQKVKDYHTTLMSQVEQDFFEKYMREHHNHAFGEVEDWAIEVDAMVIARQLSPTAFEVLGQLVDGPKFDGDVVSKNGKSELYKHNLALRICNNGDHGDNAANLLGWKVYNRYKENRGLK